MYLKYYLLREAPFGVTPDPGYLYLSPTHKEALASVLYGVNERKGFVTVTGEVGSGKTTLMRAILGKIDPGRVIAVYLFNPELSFAELIRSIFQELGLRFPDGDVDLAVRYFHGYLIQKYREHKHVLLIVDEAQRIPIDTLERLRILSNLETAKDKLLQIVLCGQPELNELLAKNELRQLRQRIAVRAAIAPLSRRDSIRYIEHRLSRAGYGRTPIFSAAGLKRIARHAAGNPRVINIVCDNALVAGYAKQEKTIGVSTIKEAVQSTGPERTAAIPRWVVPGSSTLLLLAAAFLVLWGMDLKTLQNRSVSASRADTAPLGTVLPADGSTQSVKGPMADPIEDIHVPADNAAPASSEPAVTNDDELAEGHAMESKDPGGAIVAEIQAAPGPGSLMAVDRSEKETTGSVPEPGESSRLETDGPQATLTVMPGDCLSRLVEKVYGHTSPELVERVVAANRHIRDADAILEGDILSFPQIADVPGER